MLRVTLLLALARLSVSTLDPELHIKYLQLPREQFIKYFNSQNYSWKITHYPHLDHMKFFGALPDDGPTGLEIKRHDPTIYSLLPENFDARENWPNCHTMKEVYDQGDCGSCWAFGAATVASDRTCTGKGINVRLSEQDYDCLSTLCLGGNANMSFPFWRDHGLVTQECKPYDIFHSFSCTEECVDPAINYENDKHFAEEVYGVSSNESDIKAELFKNGPVYASFVVYEDFMSYKSGVYKHQYGNSIAHHGVRVLGYGRENGDDYWLVANSWGGSWGENGLFRIQRYQELLEFENNMYSGLAKN